MGQGGGRQASPLILQKGPHMNTETVMINIDNISTHSNRNIKKEQLQLATKMAQWGFRKNEICSLKKSDVYDADGTVKPNIGRKAIPVPEELRNALGEYQNYLRDRAIFKTGEDALLPNYTKAKTLQRHWEDCGLSYRTIRAAGMKDLRQQQGRQKNSCKIDKVIANQYGISARQVSDKRRAGEVLKERYWRKNNGAEKDRALLPERFKTLMSGQQRLYSKALTMPVEMAELYMKSSNETEKAYELLEEMRQIISKLTVTQYREEAEDAYEYMKEMLASYAK